MSERREFFRYVLPSVAAFALSGVYCIVDGYFVGNRLGDLGLAAINLAYPVAAFFSAAGTGIGLAGAIRFAILRSQGHERESVRCFSGAALLLVAASALLMALVLAFAVPLLRLLGAEGEVLAPAVEYTRAIASGAFMQVLGTGLVPFIRNLGGAAFAMVTMCSGFITNVVLDFLFVWVFGWGMAGAAWATVLGQAVTALLAAGYLTVKRVGLARPGGFGPILKLSLAPFGLTFSPQITAIFMNRALMAYGGDRAVAVYSCIAYVIYIAYLLLQGVGDGSQPLISRYFGEGRPDSLKRARSLAYISAAVVAGLCVLGLFLLRGGVGALFGASAETNADTADILPLFLVPLLPLAYVRVTISWLCATARAGLSYVLVYAEPVLTLCLLAFMPGLTELGVWLAVPAAQIITFAAAVIIKRRLG